jgi:uncharacterized membrane protein
MSETTYGRADVPKLESALEALRRRAREAPEGVETATRVVYAGTAAYAALFVFAAVIHYLAFETSAADLGHMVQAIWTTMHGHVLEMTTLPGHQRSRLGFHVDPFLVLLVPLYWAWSNPVLLPVLQALVVASGALPVYWLARKHLGSNRAGANFALAYLLYPATQFNAFTVSSSFHPASIAVPLVLFAVWFLDEDRLVAFSVVALLAASTKEEIPLAVGCLGIWYAVRRRRVLFGTSVFVVGLSATLFNFLYVIPHFSPTGIDPFAGRYTAVGGTPEGMVRELFSDPLAFVHTVASGHKAVFLGFLLVPFLGLWLLEPLLFLGAVPELAISLLSSKSDQTSVAFHYTAGIVPFVVAASVFGCARLKGGSARLSLYALAGAAAVAVYSPLLLVKSDVEALASPLTSVKAHAVSLVPTGARVSASNKLEAHVSDGRYVYVFPYVRSAQWIVVDIDDPGYADPAAYKRKVRQYEADPDWRTVYSARGVAVLRKRAGARS